MALEEYDEFDEEMQEYNDEQYSKQNNTDSQNQEKNNLSMTQDSIIEENKAKKKESENLDFNSQEKLSPAFVRNVLKDNLEQIETLNENERVSKVFDELDTEEMLKENLSNNQQIQNNLKEQIKQKEELLQENPKLTDKEEQTKSLEVLKKELQRLKDEEENLKQSLKDNATNIDNAISELFTAKDINQVVKLIMGIARASSKARLLKNNLKDKKGQRKDKHRELKEIKAKDKQIEEFLKIFKKIGNSKEAKELMYILLKDMSKAKKEIKQDYKALEKEHHFYKEVTLLLNKRNNTNNLNANTEELQKLFNKINKESPNFAKHYENTFKTIENMFKGNEQFEKNQNFGRAV